MVMQSKAKAAPTKAFFVEMLVKDVALDSAILDLLDNCIDGAKRLRGEGRYEGLSVDIRITEGEFEIADNCGGIDLDTAINYAFNFGTSPSFGRPDNSLGVFGVGMKRAIFKMGRDINIRSVSEAHTFTIKENIPDWQQREDPDGWYFPIEYQENAVKYPESDRGTRIKITGLYDPVRQQFGSEYFSSGLRRTIGAKHHHHLQKGLAVRINGMSIPSADVKFAYLPNSQLVPAFEQRPLDGVAMQLFAGIGEVHRPSAGWYIYCNGRMIVEHDQTELTGWGESVDIAIPRFHHQFARFRGCLFFDSAESSKLPWNTTKDGIDAGSEVYRSAKVRMVTHMRTIIDFLNRLDKELEEPDESKRVLLNMVGRAQYAEPLRVPKASRFTYVAPAAPRPPPEDTRITFYRPRTVVDRLKGCMGVRSNKEAVEKMFDWYMENVCPDDD